MLATSQIQLLTGLAKPVLTVYLNTHNPNPSRHPRVSDNLVWWLRKEAEAHGRTLGSQDARQFQKTFARIEDFLDGRHPQEKALVLFAGLNTWTVIPLQAAVAKRNKLGKTCRGTAVPLAWRACVIWRRGHGPSRGAILRIPYG
jgi:hypothetical protein